MGVLLCDEGCEAVAGEAVGAAVGAGAAGVKRESEEDKSGAGLLLRAVKLPLSADEDMFRIIGNQKENLGKGGD